MPNASNDLPPGAPDYMRGPLANPAPTVAQFRASGQQDVSRFLSPPLPATPPVGVTVQPAVTTGWADRARAGIMSLFGVSPTATVTPPVAAARTTQLENALDDLEKRSTQVSPVYQMRVAAYNGGSTKGGY